MVETLDDLQVHVALFDKQHAELTRLLAAFRDAMRYGTPKEQLLPMIVLLFEKTKFHFESEQEPMRAFNYEGYEAHKNEHDAFLKHLLEFKHDYEDDLRLVNLENFVRDVRMWILKHIKTKDKLYSVFLNENGVC